MLILNTPLVKIIQTKQGYEMEIMAKDGTIIQMQPYKNDLEGLVNAVSLSAEILAGKFYPVSIKKENVVMIEQDVFKNKLR